MLLSECSGGACPIPCARHCNLKQDYTVSHVSVSRVNFLATELAISITLDNVTILAAISIKAIKACVPNGRVHAFDVLFDRAILGNPLVAKTTMRDELFRPFMC